MPIPKLCLKNRVHINGAHFYPEMVKIINVLRATAPQTMDSAIWITSANDSQHMTNSLHYKNKAFDVRIRNIVGDQHSTARSWAAKVSLALGEDYDVILEQDHLHVELDPK